MRKSLNLILKQFSELDYVHPEDIPNIDLYVDQVTTFIESQLSSLKRDEDEKILTKTMINNLKSFLSIKDIQTLLEPITDKYFGTESELSFYELYEELVAQGNGQSKALIKDVIAKYNAMQNAFSDAPEEDQEFLRNFGFICMLSFDVYIKKMMIETLIDFNSQQRKAAADQAKEKKDKS